jgi:hypothetical protein
MTLMRHSLLGGAVVAYAVPESADIAATPSAVPLAAASAARAGSDASAQPPADASEQFLNAFMMASDRLSKSLQGKKEILNGEHVEI